MIFFKGTLSHYGLIGFFFVAEGLLYSHFKRGDKNQGYFFSKEEELMGGGFVLGKVRMDRFAKKDVCLTKWLLR